MSSPTGSTVQTATAWLLGGGHLLMLMARGSSEQVTRPGHASDGAGEI